MFDISLGAYLIAALSVVLVGIGKAGFGGGVGVIATPLMALAMGERAAIGVLLPVLCACDAFSVMHYYKHWDRRSVALLMPGALLGAAFIVYVPNEAEKISQGLSGAFFGVFLILMVYLAPKGAGGLLQSASGWVKRRL